MKLKNMLIVVKDIERSKAFYRDLFGLVALAEFEGNVVLTEGLVLQEANIWESCINKTVGFGTNNVELYFEENDMDRFEKRLDQWSAPVKFVTPFSQNEWGQRLVRLYDPDGHMIEVRESMVAASRRNLDQAEV